MTTMCIVQLFRNPCDMKATDCNFFDRYVYPSGSWGAIDTDTAPKCFYELISALIKVNGLYCMGIIFLIFHKLMKNDTSMIPLRLRSTSYTETANLKKKPISY